MAIGRTWTDGLPPRVLTIVLEEVARLYPSTGATMRMVCRAWCRCAPAPRRNPLEAAAADGFVNLVDFFSTHKKDLRRLDVLASAVKGGHVNMINHIGDALDPTKVLRGIVEVPDYKFSERPWWFKKTLNNAFKHSGEGGCLDVVKLLASWKPSMDAQIECMVYADINDHVDVIKFFDDGAMWTSKGRARLLYFALPHDAVRCISFAFDPNDYVYLELQRSFMVRASCAGSVKSLRFGIEKKFDLDRNACLACAGQYGHIETMRILWHELGADDANLVLNGAASENRVDAMRVARDEFGATNIGDALITSASNNKVDAMCAARELGATNFAEALKKSRKTANDCVWDLLTGWIEEARNCTCGGDGRVAEPPLKRPRCTRR